MKIEAFGSEEWLDVYETQATLDISQSSIAAFSLEEILSIDGQSDPATLFADLKSRVLSYGFIEGSPAFKKEVARLYESVSPDDILQTPGGTGANLQSLMTFIEPGDHVVSFAPGYQQLYDLPRALGAEVTILRLREENAWRIDLDELAAALRPNTKMIAFANANNPTGALVERPELEAIVELARARGAYVHVDEVFESFDSERDTARIADLYERGISTGSVSKAYSMPGIRIGWTASSKELACAMRRYRDYLFICTGGIDDALAVHTLANRDAIFARNRALLCRNLSILRDWIATQPRVSAILPPDVSVLFARIAIPQPIEEFCVDMLHDVGVLLIPGSRFGVEGYARIGYCCHTDVLKQGLQALGTYVSKFDEP